MVSLISVLNYQDKESLEKLLFSSTKDVEAEKILVDDNSGVEGVEELAKEYGWMYIKNPISRGIATAANIGIDTAKNKKIILLDPDTYAPSGALESLALELDIEEVGVIGPQLNDPNSWTYQYNDQAPKLKDFEKIEDAYCVFDKYAAEMKETFKDDGLKETRVTGSVLGFRKEVWLEFNGFDENFKEGFFEDTDFVSRIIANDEYKSAIKKGVFISHGGLESNSRTIFQRGGLGMLLNAAYHNIPLYAKEHGILNTAKHIFNGFKSMAGYNTISSEVKVAMK